MTDLVRRPLIGNARALAQKQLLFHIFSRLHSPSRAQAQSSLLSGNSFGRRAGAPQGKGLGKRFADMSVDLPFGALPAQVALHRFVWVASAEHAGPCNERVTHRRHPGRALCIPGVSRRAAMAPAKRKMQAQLSGAGADLLGAFDKAASQQAVVAASAQATRHTRRPIRKQGVRATPQQAHLFCSGAPPRSGRYLVNHAQHIVCNPWCRRCGVSHLILCSWQPPRSLRHGRVQHLGRQSAPFFGG